RGSADLRIGHTVFLELPEPVLGFMRGENMMCLYNLSTKPVTVEPPYRMKPVLQQSVKMDGAQVTLGGSGFVIGRVA
ncbi:MAG: alpha-glucosidase, partial [Pseudomonadota bacterium]